MNLITSNTIVKNGMPFIGKVLEQVAPLMDKMVITLSEKSNDGTKDEVLKFVEKYLDKTTLLYENVSDVAELTHERNRQLQHSDSEWILLLDDDDYWLRDQLESCLKELPKNPEILTYAVNPIQLLSRETHNKCWEGKKWFGKFMRKSPDLHYIRPWPRDMPMNNGEMLHYSKKKIHLPYRFYHLQHLKSYSFRKEGWAKEFNKEKISPEKLSTPVDFL